MLSDAELSQVEPNAIFHLWLEEARRSEPNDPNAAALATATASGQPSVRMVLVKEATDKGFTFFTNTESQKGTQLTANPFAALCFHWKSLRRQVRVEGLIDLLSAEVTAEYFHSRSKASQIGAAVSLQSRPLPSRSVLEEQVKTFTATHPGDVPLPATWRGYLLRPSRVEFWEDGPDRLHDRALFTRQADMWIRGRLYP